MCLFTFSCFSKLFCFLIELSVEDCQDYPKLKETLLTAYGVVPEVYWKRFRNLNKHNSETFSEFAFIGAVPPLAGERGRELIQFVQFNTSLDWNLRISWHRSHRTWQKLLVWPTSTLPSTPLATRSEFSWLETATTPPGWVAAQVPAPAL